MYDEMSVDSHWQVSTKQMGCAWLKDSNRLLLSLLVSFVDSVCSRFLITLTIALPYKLYHNLKSTFDEKGNIEVEVWIRIFAMSNEDV